MSLPPYPADDWGRWRVGAVLFVVLTVLAGQQSRPARKPHRRPVVVEERVIQPLPWLGCCKARPEL